MIDYQFWSSQCRVQCSVVLLWRCGDVQCFVNVVWCLGVVMCYQYLYTGIPGMAFLVCGSVWKCVEVCVEVCGCDRGEDILCWCGQFFTFLHLNLFCFHRNLYIYTYYSKISRIEISKQITLQITLFLTNYQIIHLNLSTQQ